MPYVTDTQGFPLNKWHGFAVTALKIMMRYPWYSVDSTTWCVYARCGVVMVPRWSPSEGFVYDENIFPIVFSNRSPSKLEVGGRHFDNLPAKIKEAVREYIHLQGYVVGKSSWKTVPLTYELKDN